MSILKYPVPNHPGNEDQSPGTPVSSMWGTQICGNLRKMQRVSRPPDRDMSMPHFKFLGPVLKNFLMLWIASGVCVAGNAATHTGVPIPSPTQDVRLASTHGKQIAVFAGGCFWGTQSVFERLKGVVDTTVGYSGGTKATATYEQVCSEKTGHAESVRIVFDPSRITYGKLLQIFFAVAHDPTEVHRIGPNLAPSYRSAIFYANEEQRRIGAAYIAQLNAAKVFPNPIVTELVPLKVFYKAESYHQDYALQHPENDYIKTCAKPKIEALKATYPELFQEYKGK